jgi:hypothetical protein
MHPDDMPAGTTQSPDIPDPMPDVLAEQAGKRLRNRIRAVFGLIMLAALITIVVRGIYVAWNTVSP